MRACVRREWRLGDDRGATADAVELAEWTINYIAADPALPLQNVDRLNAREGRPSTARSDRDDPDEADPFVEAQQSTLATIGGGRFDE